MLTWNHLQNIANQLPDVFTSSEKVVKSHIPAANALFRIEIPEEKKVNIAANESIPRLKREKLIGAKDKNPRKQKLQRIDDGILGESSSVKQTSNLVSKSSPSIEPHEEGLLEENQVPGNNEISINYVHTGEILERDKIIIECICI